MQFVSDYVGLVHIRALSGDIRRLRYYELLRCSGIHLDESAMMTELHRETGLTQITTALPWSNEPPAEISVILPLTLLSSLPSLWSFPIPLSLRLLHVFQFLGVFFLSLSAPFPPYMYFYSSPPLLFNCHLPLAISVIQIPGISSVTGGGSEGDKEKARRWWEEKWSVIHQELKRKRKHFFSTPPPSCL